MKNILKYLKEHWIKYGIETIVVIAGILIAFSLNNWYTARTNRQKEIQILHQLKKEYNDNLSQLNQKIELRHIAMNSVIKLLEYRENYTQLIHNDSVDVHLYCTLLTPTFDPTIGVTTELISSGNLYLINNPELRLHLSTWTSYVDQLTEEEVVITDFILNFYWKFLIENYQIGNVYSAGRKNLNIINKFSLSSANLLPDSISFTSGNIESFLHNDDLEDYLVIILTKSITANDQSLGVLKEIENILCLIDQDLLD